MKIAVVCLIFLVSAITGLSQVEQRDKAIEFYRDGQYDKAIIILEDLRKNAKADHPSLSYLGAAYLRSGKPDDALNIFKHLDKAGPLLSETKYERNYKILSKSKPDCMESGFTTQYIKLAIELNASGKIGFVFPISATSATFIKRAVKVANGIQFDPAILNGKPVSVVIMVEYSCSVS